MRFEIIEFTNNDLENPTNCDIGYIDLNNIQDSKFNKYVSYIPTENQKELNNSGETNFKVEKTIFVRLIKQNNNS